MFSRVTKQLSYWVKASCIVSEGLSNPTGVGVRGKIATFVVVGMESSGRPMYKGILRFCEEEKHPAINAPALRIRG